MGLSEDWLAARPTYADYLSLLADRGEFGTENVEAELASRLERHRARAEARAHARRWNRDRGAPQRRARRRLRTDLQRRHRAPAGGGGGPCRARCRRGRAGAADSDGRHPEGHRQFALRRRSRPSTPSRRAQTAFWRPVDRRVALRGRQGLSRRPSRSQSRSGRGVEDLVALARHRGIQPCRTEAGPSRAQPRHREVGCQNREMAVSAAIARSCLCPCWPKAKQLASSASCASRS